MNTNKRTTHTVSEFPLEGFIPVRGLEGKVVERISLGRDRAGYHAVIISFDDGSLVEVREESQTGEIIFRAEV